MMLGFGACKSGLDPSRLELPAGAVVTGAKNFKISDPEKLASDFAKIDTGTPVGDGFVMNKKTDAEALLDELKSGPRIIFLRLSANEDERKSVNKTVKALMERAEIKKSDYSISYLDIEALNKEIHTLGLSNQAARDYYASAASKINAKVNKKTALVVRIDDLLADMPVKEFFEILSTPKILALSREPNKDGDIANTKEYRPTGLNAGEVYVLVHERLKRAEGLKDPVIRDAQSLKIAKIIAAMRPFGNLEDVEESIKSIAPIVESKTLPATYADDIMRALSSRFNVGLQFLIAKNFDAKLLQTVNTETTNSRIAYNEMGSKTQEILALLGPLALPGIARVEDINRLQRQIRTMVDNAEVNILDDAEEKKNQTSQEIRRSVQQVRNNTRDDLNKASENIKNDLRSEVKRVRERVGQAEQALSDLTIEKVAETEATLQNALKRLGLQNNAEVNRVVSQLRQNLVNTLARNTKEVTDVVIASKDEVKEDVLASGETTRDAVRKETQKSVAAINQNTVQKVNDAQKATVRETKNAVQESEANIKNFVEEKTDALADSLNQTTRQINNSIANLGKKAEAAQETNKSLVQLINKLRKELGDESQATRDLTVDEVAKVQEAIADRIRKNGLGQQASLVKATADLRSALLMAIVKAKGDINGNVDERIDEVKNELRIAEANLRIKGQEQSGRTRDSVIASVQKEIRDFEGRNKKDRRNVIDGAVEEMRQNIDDSLRVSQGELTKAIQELRAQTEASFKAGNQDVKVHINNQAKKTREANEDLGARLGDKIDENAAAMTAEMAKLPKVVRAQTVDLMRKLAGFYSGTLKMTAVDSLINQQVVRTTVAQGRELTVDIINATQDAITQARALLQAGGVTWDQAMLRAGRHYQITADPGLADPQEADVGNAIGLIPEPLTPQPTVISEAPRPVVPEEWEKEFTAKVAEKPATSQALAAISDDISDLLTNASARTGNEISYQDLRDRYELVFHVKRLDNALKNLEEKALINASQLGEYQKAASEVLKSHRAFEQILRKSSDNELPTINNFPEEDTIKAFNQLEDLIKELSLSAR